MADLYPLAWSTLGSPSWSFEHTVEQAAGCGGWRGGSDCWAIGSEECGHGGDDEQHKDLCVDGDVLDASSPSHADDVRDGDGKDQGGGEQSERCFRRIVYANDGEHVFGADESHDADGARFNNGGHAEDVEEGGARAVTVAKNCVLSAAAVVHAAEFSEGECAAECNGSTDGPDHQSLGNGWAERGNAGWVEKDANANDGADDDAGGVDGTEDARGLVGLEGRDWGRHGGREYRFECSRCERGLLRLDREKTVRIGSRRGFWG